MDWLLIAGAVSFGILIGCLALHTVLNQTRITVPTLVSVVGVLAGAAVIGFLGKFAAPNGPWPQGIASYPIGLLIGAGGLFGVRKWNDYNQTKMQDDRNTIFNYMDRLKHADGSPVRLLKYETLRRDLNRSQQVWPDKYLDRVIARHSEEFRAAPVGGEPGIGLKKYA